MRDDDDDGWMDGWMDGSRRWSPWATPSARRRKRMNIASGGEGEEDDGEGGGTGARREKEKKEKGGRREERGEEGRKNSPSKGGEPRSEGMQVLSVFVIFEVKAKCNMETKTK